MEVCHDIGELLSNERMVWNTVTSKRRGAIVGVKFTVSGELVFRDLTLQVFSLHSAGLNPAPDEVSAVSNLTLIFS